MSVLPRMRACRFSSVVSAARPANDGASARSYPAITSWIATVWIRIPSAFASPAASCCDASDV